MEIDTLATSCKELTHGKRLWCWEGLGAGGEGDDRGWDGWMASPTRWTWVWVNSRSWWWTGRPGVLQFMGSQGSRTQLSNWTELNWTEVEIRTMKKHKSEEGNKSQIAILYIVVKGGKMIKDGIAWRAKPSTDTDKEPSRPRKKHVQRFNLGICFSV